MNVGQSPGATLGGDATAAEGAGAECAQDITTGTDIASVGLVSRIRILGDRATMRRVGAVRERTIAGGTRPASRQLAGPPGHLHYQANCCVATRR